MIGSKLFFFITITAVLLVAGYFGWKLTARGAYESAEYTLLESDGKFEIREYPDLMMASTNMKFEQQGDDGSFMRLFNYISGENDQAQKVAMTTPVFMETGNREDNGQMGFVIPKELSKQDIPYPADNEVQLQRRAGGRFAVIRFAGRIDSESVAKSEATLRQWIDRNEWEIGEADAEFAGYDPPWTPGPLRRNEILIRLK